MTRWWKSSTSATFAGELALIPTLGGILMGLAGLFGWRIHPDAIARLLS